MTNQVRALAAAMPMAEGLTLQRQLPIDSLRITLSELGRFGLVDGETNPSQKLLSLAPVMLVVRRACEQRHHEAHRRGPSGRAPANRRLRGEVPIESFRNATFVRCFPLAKSRAI